MIELFIVVIAFCVGVYIGMDLKEIINIAKEDIQPSAPMEDPFTAENIQKMADGFLANGFTCQGTRTGRSSSKHHNKCNTPERDDMSGIVDGPTLQAPPMPPETRARLSKGGRE